MKKKMNEFEKILSIFLCIGLLLNPLALPWMFFEWIVNPIAQALDNYEPYMDEECWEILRTATATPINWPEKCKPERDYNLVF